MPTINATPAAENANSYLSEEETLEMADERLDATDFFTTPLTDDEKRALIMATRRLDQEIYLGDAVTGAQALAFPRYGIINRRTGLEYPSNVVPKDIKRAQFELALALRKGTYSIEDSGLEAIDQMNVGPVNITPRNRAADALPANVERYLFDFIASYSGAEIVRS